MEVSGEVAELVVKEGIELSGEAVKLAGQGVVSAAALVAALASDQNRVVGKASVTRLARENSEILVVPIQAEDLKTFDKQAKRYGILYAAVKSAARTAALWTSSPPQTAPPSSILCWRAWAMRSRIRPRRNPPQKKRSPALHERDPPAGAGMARCRRGGIRPMKSRPCAPDWRRCEPLRNRQNTAPNGTKQDDRRQTHHGKSGRTHRRQGAK